VPVQGHAGILPRIEGELEMLARRFTIVCLIVTLFGMGFAILVAEAGRSKNQYQTAGATSCFVGQKIFCRR
jgi:hypothetical protein